MVHKALIAAIACILVYSFCVVEAGRYSYSGGSSYRSSSSYSYRSSSSYRSTRTSYRSYRSGIRSYRSYRGKVKAYKGSVSTYRGPVYVNYYDAYYAGYDVYGMSSYRSRYYGSKSYDDDPNVCTTTVKPKDSSISSSTNDTTSSSSSGLYYFVCPYKATDTQKDKFCCGQPDNQYCCPYWKSKKKAGAIVGIVLGSVGLIVVIALLCFCRD